jgi:hypothetical protein
MRSKRALGLGLGMGLALGISGLAWAQIKPSGPPTLKPTGKGTDPVPVPVPVPQLKAPIPVPTVPGTNPSVPGPKEIEAAADTACENWDFERGLQCWTNASTGNPNAFSTQPTVGDNVMAFRVMRQMEYAAGGIGGDYWKRVPYPVGGVKKSSSVPRKAKFDSQYWIGTFESHPREDLPLGSVQGDALQGELRSKPFRVRSQYLSFLVGGGRSSNVGVALQVPAYLAGKLPPSKIKRMTTSDGWVEVAVAKGNDSEIMRRQVWDLQTTLGASALDMKSGQLIARVSIFDFDSGGWGHLSVDDFLFGGTPPATFALQENGQTVLRDADMPVWGFADTHAHPTHQIGFGGKTIGGDTDGPMAQALSNDKCTNIHNGVHRVMGGRHHMHMAVGMVDEHTIEGYPTFIGWPTYRSKTHQVQHVDWMRRAFDGGQRLIVALGVTNMFWATRELGPGRADGIPIDDETVAVRQLQMMTDVVNRNASWMEIATSPEQARRIIHQNKLAVVLGIEADNFGNFKDASYTWIDGGFGGTSYSIPPSNRLVALPADREAARAMIRAKIQTYYANNKVRQITPLHYISGVFGGTAAFRAEFALISQAFTGKRYQMRNTNAQDGTYYSLFRDWSKLRGFLGTGNGDPQNYVTCVDSPRTEFIHPQNGPTGAFACGNASVNAEGLSPRGEVLIEELMRQGMLVDFEHSSASSATAITGIARRYGYPIMSSHSDVRELSFVPKSGRAWSGNAAQDLAEFGTSQIGNLPHEGMLSPGGFETVRATGGTAGVITMAYRKRGYPNDLRPLVPNDCDGSSKTYAQSYLYAVDKLGGVGVAIGTDRGFTDFIGPRFGTHASYRLRDESEDELRITRRLAQKRAQYNGVRYDIPFKFFHPSRFEFGDTPGEEEDAWKAMAYWAVRQMSPLDPRYNSLAAADRIPPSSDATRSGRIESLVRGLAASTEGQLRDCCGDTPFEEAAMFAIKRGWTPAQFVTNSQRPLFKNNLAAIQRVFDWARPVYVLWSAMNGTNEPLRKRVDGFHDWDVNIDGVAHYGMLPDMLQDMKNVGVTPVQLAPLFSSAEDYILMWERANKASASARGSLPK